jgi:acetyl-CoA acetyltransferase
VKTRESKDPKNIVILDFVRIPHYKLQESPSVLSTSIVKSCLLTLFESNSQLKENLDTILISYAKKEAAPQISFEEIFKSLELSKNITSKLSYYGEESTAKALLSACNDIHYGLSHLMIMGGMEVSLSDTLTKKQSSQKSLNKYQQKLKKSIPELSYLGEDAFSQILNFSFLEDWQKQAHDCGFSREALDALVENCYRKTEEQALLSKESLIPLLTPEPNFYLLTQDQFRDHGKNREVLKKACPILKGNFANLTAYNISLATDGSSFLILSSREKATAIGYRVLTQIIAYENVTFSGPSSIKNFLEKEGLSPQEIDFFEVSEQSASHVLSCLKELDNPPLEKVNALGGGLATGYASSAEPISSMDRLRRALELYRGTFGLAVIQNSYNHLTVFLLKREELEDCS